MTYEELTQEELTLYNAKNRDYTKGGIMPYIKQERRTELAPLIKPLGEAIQNDGEMNYVITKLIDWRYGLDAYVQLSAGMGVLSCVAQEFYRRRIVPFEIKKALENGEVFE